jgi:hypothetical protein
LVTLLNASFTTATSSVAFAVGSSTVSAGTTTSTRGVANGNNSMHRSIRPRSPVAGRVAIKVRKATSCSAASTASSTASPPIAFPRR